MDRDSVVGMLEAYARAHAAPILEMTRVRRLSAYGWTFRAGTDRGELSARAVVIATGACDLPAVPGWAAALNPALTQVTPSSYRSPAGLPGGGVIVVGASATGAQLAREIHASGRPVTLAVGRHTRLPRRYRGRDIMYWLDRAGVLDEPWDRVPDLAAARRQPSLQLSGKPEEADLSLARLAAEGVRLVGRAEGGAGNRIAVRPDLAAACAASEQRRRRTLARIDAFAAQAAPDVPADLGAWDAPRHPVSEVAGLDLAADGIQSVVWATGYRRDYRWLRLPVFDRYGEIAHRGGVTAVPGLYALGLPFLRRRGSTLIDGVGRDARALAPLIAAHLDAASARAA
jgi:putative flavoprotein involved in K+ transport